MVGLLKVKRYQKKNVIGVIFIVDVYFKRLNSKFQWNEFFYFFICVYFVCNYNLQGIVYYGLDFYSL